MSSWRCHICGYVKREEGFWSQWAGVSASGRQLIVTNVGFWFLVFDFGFWLQWAGVPASGRQLIVTNVGFWFLVLVFLAF